MLLFYIAIVALVCFGLRKRDTLSLDSALEVTQTNVVKGVFILLVFLSHIQPYIIESGYKFNGIDEKVLSWLNWGQSIVIMFLFYSGYGIHQQIQKHGEEYVRRIPLHRILNTLLNFDIAVMAFLVLALIMRTPLTVGKTLLAFTGWESLGNSNWYIFDILILYGLVWLTHTIIKDAVCQWLIFTAFSLAFILVILFTRPFWWWDTILCFWGGVFPILPQG